MTGCLRTSVRKQPTIALYFEFENELKFYNLDAKLLLYMLTICAQLQNKFMDRCLKPGHWEYIKKESGLTAVLTEAGNAH